MLDGKYMWATILTIAFAITGCIGYISMSTAAVPTAMLFVYYIVFMICTQALRVVIPNFLNLYKMYLNPGAIKIITGFLFGIGVFLIITCFISFFNAAWWAVIFNLILLTLKEYVRVVFFFVGFTLITYAGLIVLHTRDTIDFDVETELIERAFDTVADFIDDTKHFFINSYNSIKDFFGQY